MNHPPTVVDGHIKEYLTQRAKLFDPSTASRFDHVSCGITSFADTDAYIHSQGNPVTSSDTVYFAGKVPPRVVRPIR